MTKFTYFISDLHLQPSEPTITALFQQFLNTAEQDADAIYILGDLFEAWLGDDDLTEFNQNIIATLRDTSQKIPLFIMPGNRDFLMGQQFANMTGCTLLTDPTVVTVYDQKILLMHGDTLCTQDKRHQYYRRIIQHPFIKRISLLLPLSFRRHLGSKLRHVSQQHTSKQYAPIMDVITSTVEENLQRQNAKILIHGHTHRALKKTLIIDQQPHTRYVLGAWHDVGNTLRIDSNQQFEYIIINKNQ